MDVWMYGYVDVWMYGCMAVWMYGCMDVWMYGCMYVTMYVFLYVYIRSHFGSSRARPNCALAWSGQLINVSNWRVCCSAVFLIVQKQSDGGTLQTQHALRRLAKEAFPNIAGDRQWATIWPRIRPAVCLPWSWLLRARGWRCTLSVQHC